MSDCIHLQPSKGLHGAITLPGDKSLSHRAVLLGSIAEGETEVTGFLPAEDTLNTVRVVQHMGIRIERTGSDRLLIQGNGLDGLSEPEQALDLGNSGTGMRLLAGLLAGQDFFSVLTGDQYLLKRPMDRIVQPLRQMNAVIDGRANGKFAPLAIRGGGIKTKAIDYGSPVASAQVKSAILLAGLYAHGVTSVLEPSKSRDHTERMLRFFTVDVKEEGLRVSIQGRQPLRAGEPLAIPADISSAAFFLVAASIVPGSDLLIRNVGLNPTRTGILDVLAAMGANITIEQQRELGGEPAGDLRVRYQQLHGIEVAGDMVLRALDEIPVLSVAAAYAEGTTVIRDAAELRVKESDRIATISTELRKLGVSVIEQQDGMKIQGNESIAGGDCESHGDHRIAMSMAVAGLAARGETTVHDCGWIETSFPGFEQLLKQAAY
ncbi:MAG: 3-phosphoshikimate 1-carboxyvinyltransferase [Nitrospirota bacterium]